MKCLVTGAGGFLGRYIVEKLVARGDTVRGLARGKYPELQELGVEFTVETTEYDGAKFAIFDDTCGNLVQIFQNPD